MIQRILRHASIYSLIDLLRSKKRAGPNEDSIHSLHPTASSLTSVTAPQAAREYAELKHLIKQHGLLEKQPVYYTFMIALMLALVVLGIVLLILVRPLWLQLLNAVYLAIVTTQLGLLGHDAGHRQIFRKTWKNDLIGLVTGNLLIGMSNGWWMDKHNKHHSHPNQMDLDPDIDIPVLAMTGDDLFKEGKIQQFIVKYQSIFFFPILSLVALSLQASSIRFLFLTREKYHTLEVVFMVLHYVGYLGLLFTFLGIWQAVLFIVVHQLLSGMYLGSIFAPNHKGMAVIEKESELGFLYRQIITARNVKAHPITDFWYGGLNYQIEHHLFPSMPRNRLREAQRLTKAFCHERSIPYYETSMLGSYQEILQYLHQVSAPLRATRP